MDEYEEIEVEFRKINGEALPEYAKKIPSMTLSALVRYVMYGTPIGDFLTAFLSNNLARAIGHADDNNIKSFKELHWLLYNRLPQGCYGSPEKIKAWREAVASVSESAHE